MQTTSVRNDGGESTGITLLDYVPLADGNLLHMLQPERATNLIFTWLEIVAHRERCVASPDPLNAVSQEAPPPPQGRKAGGQQANAGMLCSARATQHLANLQYNVELTMNVVLYICITAVKTLRHCLLLNCMANQLRYPNSHTYYFSNTLLCLFAEQSKERMKELISRVLMESGA
ncbi:unnamed protein product [Mesocestoides corti]|uniref:CCR4-Not complex component Not1 C-terminal domain-containing protein n=1 Tax=Mesocestoides corti TaxID=53468 RepID=A0A0R3URU4_MESCO|nr:unnamed protein product [Mesocestoides corti]